MQRVLYSYASIKGDSNIPAPFSDLMLDSGAFSVETGVEKVSLKSYTLWLNLYLEKYPQITRYVTLDDLSDPEVSRQNMQYMESEGLSPMPVYHYGENSKYLDFMCSKYEYVGLGGMAVGTMNNTSLQSFWEEVYERYSDNKFHIFGVGTLAPFFNCQPYSMDSTSWNVGGRFGDLMGYKDGLPYRLGLRGIYGFTLFLTTEELFKNNIRALLDWEKLEWLKNIPQEGNVKYKGRGKKGQKTGSQPYLV